jgi:hypothetical protein
MENEIYDYAGDVVEARRLARGVEDYLRRGQWTDARRAARALASAASRLKDFALEKEIERANAR